MSLMINQSGQSFSAPVIARPLSSNISIEGYNIGYSQALQASKYSGVFDGKNLWVPAWSDEKQPLNKIDVATGKRIEYTSSEMRLPSSVGAYDGKYIWFISINGEVARLNPLDNNITKFPIINGINGNANLPEIKSFNCAAIFDGKYIWFGLYQGHLIRLDPSNGSMTGCYSGSVMSGSYARMIYAENKIWQFSYSKSGSCHLVRFDPESLESKFYEAIEIENTSIRTNGLCYLNGDIWMIALKNQNNIVIKFNIQSETMSQYPIKDNINGNYNVGDAGSKIVEASTLNTDGKYIWLFTGAYTSNTDDRLIIIDPETGSMQGYTLSGTNIGDETNKLLDFKDIAYDGKNIWLIPRTAKHLLKVSSADDPTHTVTEEYEDTTGTSIKPGAYRWVTPGEAYTGTALVIDRYVYLGHKIDGGALQPGHTATIPDVQANHTVTFVYQAQDEITDLGITERYLNSDGTALLPDTFLPMNPGQDYESVAPRLTGYKRTGHQIDGGVHLTTRTARIPDVRQSHTVTFTYEPCDGEKCQDILITESYLDTISGQLIQADTYTYVAHGDDYQMAAPVLSGYKRTGHRIDDGPDSASLTAEMLAVEQDHHAFFLYEPGEDQPDRHVPVTEEYFDVVNGVAIRPDTTTLVDYGERYGKFAPVLEGYKRVGHRIDGGPDRQGLAAVIDSVITEHTVTFLYEPVEEGGAEDRLVVTEQYYDRVNDRFLQPDTYATVVYGGNYSKNQPYLTRYRRVGHRIDGGADQANLTARIGGVVADHVVTFLYEPVGSGMGEDERVVVESYYDVVNDEYIRPDTFTVVDYGGRYGKFAPILEGYKRVGHRIDDGPDRTNLAAVIENVTQDHRVTFYYEPTEDGGHEDRLVVTEEYYDVVNGRFLQGDTYTTVAYGSNYTKAEPAISRYRRVGHRIDGGPELPSLTARLSPVVADHTVTFLYEPITGGTGDDERIIIESYYDTVNGEYIKADTYSVVKVGADYAKGAPAIQGYQRTGHCIDAGPDSTRLTAVIENVRENHQVTFLYEPTEEGGGEDRLMITESYLDTTTGERIRPDTYTVGRYGGTYQKTAPVLPGYKRTGHRIDDGVDSTGLTATIEKVTRDHHVTFLYQPGEDNGGDGNGNGDGGKCCCKCMPMMPCIPVMMMPVMPCMPMQWPNCGCCCGDPDGEKPTDPGPGTDPDDEDDCDF